MESDVTTTRAGVAYALQYDSMDVVRVTTSDEVLLANGPETAMVRRALLLVAERVAKSDDSNAPNPPPAV